MVDLNSNKSLPRFSWLVLGVIAIWVLFDISVWACFPDWTARGQFGDMFGAVNALFSALAFGAVAYAVFLQRHQLVAQERGLKLSAQLNATAALIAAYTERARYLDSRASPDSKEVNRCQERIKVLADELEISLKEARE